MATTTTLIGIDLGTSSVKVVLTEPSGVVVAQAGAGYPIDRPQPGWAHTDPQDWWTAIRTALAQVMAGHDPNSVAGIGLSGQMHGVVLADAESEPVHPAVLWSDARAHRELDILRGLPTPVRARLANPLSPGMAGPILGWLQRNDPESIRRARVALQPKDWIRARLTGRFAAEPSDASATLLYDVLTQTWDPDVCSALGIPTELLPDILPASGVQAGELQTGPAAELGLPAGLPVAAGAADTAAALLGSGLIVPGTVQLTIGTGVQIVTPVPTPTAATLPAPAATVTHLYRSATTDGWYAMAAGLTGGQTLDWVRRMLGVDWSQLYAAARTPRPTDPLFLPHLNGERTPYLDTSMRGAWMALDARHDRDDLLSAALEGVAFAAADALDAMPGPRPSQLWLAGGGTTAPAWRQLLADVLQTELLAVDVAGASARGAGLLGAFAAGMTTQADISPASTTPVATPRSSQAVFAEPRARYRAAIQAHRAVTRQKSDG